MINIPKFNPTNNVNIKILNFVMSRVCLGQDQKKQNLDFLWHFLQQWWCGGQLYGYWEKDGGGGGGGGGNGSECVGGG